MGNLLLVSISLGCAVLFSGIGIYSYLKKTPVHFFMSAGADFNHVTDVREYNKANSMMWAAYSLFYWAGGITGIFNEKVGGVIIILSTFPGLYLLMLCYKKITEKYFKS